mmetsp:Transcript_9118/g.22803  ORF Transcript_9118/g.22803 Transcript_9118/m.22803 type:complete len:300 (-) Transcript_9118:1615-2514(-)
MARPSSTALTMVVKLSSASTILAAPCATAVPEPMATPMSAALRAGASLTPSPVMAATSPGPPLSSDSCRHSTMFCLWMGSVREKRLALLTAAILSDLFMFENSRPVNDLPVRSSPSLKTPILRQMVSAVFWLSPVMTMTRMPASLQVSMAGFTSRRGGSRMPTMPMKVSPLSISSNFLGSARRGSVSDTPAPMACARQRRAFMPLPYSSSTLLMREARIAAVMATTLPLLSIAELQRPSTDSGAPLTRSCESQTAFLPLPLGVLAAVLPAGSMSTLIDLRSRANSRVALTSNVLAHESE